MSLQAIRYAKGSLQLLDQRLLPHEFTYLDVKTPQDGWQHIKDMVVRGAPAIGVTGVLTIAMDLVANKDSGKAFSSAQDCLSYVISTADYLVTSRPTAVNLADGLDKVKAAAQEAATAAGATSSSVADAVIVAAEAYFDADITCNKAIGKYGAERLLSEVVARNGGSINRGLRVLTHCNTGSLATAGFGTALGIIRALHEQGKLEHAYCTETRPYNQGARLTAYELTHDGIPATLVCDSATCYLMSLGQVDAVVVGADRVVANGDTANKIGTYMLSTIAAHHNIPFFIAAPTTTLDPNLESGSHIEIEQRPAEELTHFRGTRVVTEKIQVWNPSFDVAPGSLTAAIVTEKGVIPKEGSVHQVRAFMSQHGLLKENGTANGHADGTGPQAFTTESLKDYVISHPELLQHVGPKETRDQWSVREVGDGNINFVFILEGPAGGLAIKQSLPYVRCVGESWPLTQDRVRIEAEALRVESQLAPAHVPPVYLYDAKLSVIAMQYIAPPAIILRKGLNQGLIYPKLADHISTFLANTLFGTSLLALSSAEYRARQVQFNNPEMCALTEEVIFTQPYIQHEHNRHTQHPLMETEVATLRANEAAKTAASVLKHKFMTAGDALLHGDLHTGSVMITDDNTWVIDPEFAFYGPMAFDIAKIMANLLLALFASYGQEKQAGASREKQRAWLSNCTAEIWQQFNSKFVALWNSTGAKGDLLNLLSHTASKDSDAMKEFQSTYMKQLWHDTVAFMGAFIIRRLVGIAHVSDMDSIEDVGVRAGCEARALRFGQKLLTQAVDYSTVDSVVAAATAAATPQ